MNHHELGCFAITGHQELSTWLVSHYYLSLTYLWHICHWPFVILPSDPLVTLGAQGAQHTASAEVAVASQEGKSFANIGVRVHVSHVAMPYAIICHAICHNMPYLDISCPYATRRCCARGLVATKTIPSMCYMYNSTIYEALLCWQGASPTLKWKMWSEGFANI